jgi:signal transduction histidine kinase
VKIHTRTLLNIGATVFFLIVVLALVAQFFVLSSYSQVEQQESVTNVELVTGEIQSEIEYLGESIHNQAASDATYQFMQDKNDGYIRSTIKSPPFHENLQVDGVLFFNTSGDLFYSYWFDAENQSQSRLAGDAIDYFARNRNVLPNPAGVKRRQGLLLLQKGPVIIAMHTILQASGDGSGGTLVVVRSFDRGRIADLQERTHLQVRILALNDPSTFRNPVAGELTAKGAPTVVSQIQNETTINGSTLLLDIDNNPILILEVGTPRHMNQQAVSTIIFILAAFIITGIISAIVGVLLMRKYIVLHLVDLDSTMKDIGERHDLSGRITVNGDDEIASLKQSLNMMLQELEDKQLELAEANRKANLYLEIYLDVLTYEILNSTTGLYGYADLIAHSTDPDKNRIYASRIIDVIKRDREVISNIETISAIYKNPPRQAAVDLGSVVRKSIGAIPGITFEYGGCPLTVLADDKLEIVFRNLISNSFRHGGPQVKITISVQDLRKGMVEVSVADTGKGISDEMKPLIFDRFMKGSDKRSSYGLGLHIVKMLIEAYGGRVWVEDRVAGQPGLGAVLRFTLKKA